MALVLCLSGATNSAEAQPAIVAAGPNQPDAGISGYTLTVTGTGFVQGSVVMWNGTSLPTTLDYSTQVHANVPGSLLVLSGKASVTVKNPDGSVSNGYPIYVQPVLQNISPSSVVAGSASTVVTATGIGFLPTTGAQVVLLPDGRQWLVDGTYISSTSLTLALPPEIVGAAVIVLFDGTNGVFSRALRIVITPSPIALNCTPSGPVRVGVAYVGNCSVSGGIPPYVWSVNPGAVPEGMSFEVASKNPVYVVGTPLKAGSFDYTVRVNDSAKPSPQVGTYRYTGTINPAPPPLTLNCPEPPAPPRVGSAYVKSCSVSGGTAPYLWLISAGALPPGLIFRINGSDATISGMPTIVGPYTYELRVIDAGIPTPQATTQLFMGTVQSPPLVLNCSTIAGPVQAGLAYTASCTVAGGTPPYNWSVPFGALPTGLTLIGATSSTVTVSGIPTTSGPFHYSLQVRDSSDSAPQTASQTYTGAVKAAALNLACAPTAGPAETSVRYTATCNASGGMPPYNWAVASGALPPGLTFSTRTGSAVIDGVPDVAGPFRYAIQVTDSDTPVPQARSQIFTGSIQRVQLTINPPQPLPVGRVGVQYSTQFVATGGKPPYDNWLASGALPPGLALDSATGVLSGIPSSADGSPYAFSASVQDSSGDKSISEPLSAAILPADTTLRCDTPSIQFASRMGGERPASQTVAIMGATPDTQVRYTVATSANWLSASPAVDTTPAAVRISVNPAGLGAQTYSGIVTIRPVGEPDRTIAVAVRYTISNLPTLRTSSITPISVVAGSTVAVTDTISVITDTGTDVPFIVTSTGGDWLRIGRTAGHTGAGDARENSIPVIIDSSELTPAATYEGQITVTSLQASPMSVIVPIRVLTSTRPELTMLSLSPLEINLSFPQGGSPEQRQIKILNAGTGDARFSAQIIGGGCGNDWLQTVATRTSTDLATGFITLRLDPTDVPVGTCSGQVIISNTAEASDSQTVRVNMAVSGKQHSIQLTRTGLAFVATVGGPAPAAQRFGITTRGTGTMNWALEKSTVSGGPDWLQVSQLAGVSVAGASDASMVDVSAISDGLSPGLYFGSVRVQSTTAGNSGQVVNVQLNVLPASEVLPPEATPSGVILFADLAAKASNSEELTLSNPSSSAVSYISTLVSDDGSNWLIQNPAAGTISPNDQVRMTLRARTEDLTEGAQEQATLRIFFTDGTVRAVKIRLVVASPSASERLGFSGCEPDKDLVAIFRTPSPDFQATARVPVPIELKVVSCAGEAVTDGGATATVHLGSAQTEIPLAHEGNGVWSGTWVPVVPLASAMLYGATWRSQDGTAGFASGSTNLNVSVQPGGATPAPAVSKVANAASYEGASHATPGGWITVSGDGLAEGSALADKMSFPNALIKTAAYLRDRPLPAYSVNRNQLIALIPRDIDVNERHQLFITRNGAQSVGFDVLVSDSQPGIFTVNHLGTGQGIVTVADTTLLASPAGGGGRPAKRGESIRIYAAGLGAVTDAPPDGTPANFDPLSLTLQAPVVIFGTVETASTYSGLVPGKVGVYEVHVQIPETAPTGDAVPLSLVIGNSRSNTVTVAIE